jgi:hypothetical protein
MVLHTKATFIPFYVVFGKSFESSPTNIQQHLDFVMPCYTYGMDNHFATAEQHPTRICMHMSAIYCI